MAYKSKDHDEAHLRPHNQRGNTGGMGQYDRHPEDLLEIETQCHDQEDLQLQTLQKRSRLSLQT